MLQKKLSKHFIYNWLKIDLFGEFNLHKNPEKNKLTRKILKRVWKHFMFSKKFKRLSNRIRPKSLMASWMKPKIAQKFFYYSVRRSYKFKIKLKLPKIVNKIWYSRIKLLPTYRKNWYRPVGHQKKWYYRSSFKKKKTFKKIFLKTDFTNKKYVFKKPRVKRKEKYFLKRYNLFQFFNLSQNPLSFFKLYYNSKKSFSTIASRLEFQLSNLIRRAGFIENGYLSNHLAKRGFFLVNGYPASVGFYSVVPWDIISLTNSAWWLVYARFIHFYKSIKIRYYKPRRVFFKHRRHIFKPRKTIKRLSTSFYFTVGWWKFKKKIYYRRIKNYILNPVPLYMELSYKLLLFIVFRFAKNSDIGLPYTLSSLKYLVKGKLKKQSTLVL